MRKLAFFLIEIGEPYGFLFCWGFVILAKEVDAQLAKKGEAKNDSILLYMLSLPGGDDELEAIQRLGKTDVSPWLIRCLECLRMCEDYPRTQEEYQSHFPETIQTIDDAINKLPGPIWELCCHKLDQMENDFQAKFEDVDW